MTAVMAFNRNSGHVCGGACRGPGARQDAGPETPAPPATQEEIRAFLVAGLLRDGKAVPKVLERETGERFVVVAAPVSQATRTRPATPEEELAAMDRFASALAEIDGLLDQYARETGQRFVVVEQGPEFALPATHDDGIDGDARGDEGIERRRRALELERRIMIAKKKRNGASVPDKLYWDQELERLNAELEEIHKRERAERDEHRRI